MAKIDLKKSIKGLSFFTKNLPFFGGRRNKGDQMVFDQRGAIHITTKDITKKNGEIVQIRGISDAGGNNSMVIPRPSPGSPVSSAQAMDAYHSWPYAAIKPIADEIAGIEWRVYRIVRGEKKELEEHELLDLLEGVNDFQTGPEFRNTLATHLELTGNAYILLEGVKDDRQKPTALHLLNPGRVRIVLDKTVFPYKISGYQFTIDGRTFKYQPYEILQIKYPNPSDPYQGIGTVQGIAAWINNDDAATEFLNQFYQNGGQVGLTFETEMTSEEQLQALRDSFNEQHSGVRNAYKAMFLPKGVKKPTNDVKFDDVGFDDTSDKNRDKILAGFRVPKTILGAAESDTNRATAETADYVFAKRTIKPKMLLICSYLNEFLVPRFGKDIFITFNDPVPEDKLSRSTEMKNAIGTIPVITPNEARQEYLNMEPIDGGDVLLVPTMNVPIQDAGKNPQMMLSYKPGITKTVSTPKAKVGYMPIRIGAQKTQFARNSETRQQMSKSLAAKIIEAVKDIKSKDVKELTDQEYEDVILKEKRQRVDKYTVEMRDSLVKINNEQKKVVMDNLSSATKSIKDVDGDKLFDLDKWINITISAVKPIAEAMFGKEADHALNVIDKPGLDIVNTPSAQQALDDAMNLMARSYNENTVAILKEKLNEGLSQGFGIEKLGDLVSDIYEWKNQYAAERVALTESNRITNTAGKIAWKESGVVKEIKWVTLGGDTACEFCKEMNNTKISVSDNFFDKGDTITGDDGGEITANYSDIGGPPLHPNCRCGIKPVVSKNIEASAKEDSEKKFDEEIDNIILDDSINELKELNETK